MITLNPSPPPNYGTPFLSSDGSLSLPWWSFFNQLYSVIRAIIQAINGSSSGGSSLSGVYKMGNSGIISPDGKSYFQIAGSGSGVDGALTINNPIANFPANSVFRVQIIQPALGPGHNINRWGSYYKGVAHFPLSTVAGTQATLEFLTASDGGSAQLSGILQNGASQI